MKCLYTSTGSIIALNGNGVGRCSHKSEILAANFMPTKKNIAYISHKGKEVKKY